RVSSCFPSFSISLRTALTRLFCAAAAPTTMPYTLSLHDALPILADAFALTGFVVLAGAALAGVAAALARAKVRARAPAIVLQLLDRKSTRLNSSHVKISYAVFCLKKTTEIALNSLNGAAAARTKM